MGAVGGAAALARRTGLGKMIDDEQLDAELLIDASVKKDAW